MSESKRAAPCFSSLLSLSLALSAAMDEIPCVAPTRGRLPCRPPLLARVLLGARNESISSLLADERRVARAGGGHERAPKEQGPEPARQASEAMTMRGARKKGTLCLLSPSLLSLSLSLARDATALRCVSLTRSFVRIAEHSPKRARLWLGKGSPLVLFRLSRARNGLSRLFFLYLSLSRQLTFCPPCSLVSTPSASKDRNT